MALAEILHNKILYLLENIIYYLLHLLENIIYYRKYYRENIIFLSVYNTKTTDFDPINGHFRINQIN